MMSAASSKAMFCAVVNPFKTKSGISNAESLDSGRAESRNVILVEERWRLESGFSGAEARWCGVFQLTPRSGKSAARRRDDSETPFFLVVQEKELSTMTAL